VLHVDTWNGKTTQEAPEVVLLRRRNNTRRITTYVYLNPNPTTKRNQISIVDIL